MLEADLVVVASGSPAFWRWPNRPVLPSIAEVVAERISRKRASRIYVAGDIARWPAIPHFRGNIPVELGVVAGGGKRPGGRPQRVTCYGGARAKVFDAVPFFWSQHYDLPIQLCWPCREVGRNCHFDGGDSRRGIAC